MNWFTQRLEPAEPVPGAGAFTPFARVRVRAWDRTGWGSGFVVHPRVVVTAAHVVTVPRPDGGYWIVGEIGVDVGVATVHATDVALPREFFEDGGGAGTAADLAVVLLPQPVCAYGEQLPVLDARPGQPYPSEILGYGTEAGPLRAQPVADAKLADGLLRYSAPDLPGFSGGALACRADGGVLASLGCHSMYHTGKPAFGAPTPPGLVRSAMQALGFGFSA